MKPDIAMYTTFTVFGEAANYLKTAVCSDEGLTLETSAKHHFPQATNIPYQPC